MESLKILLVLILCKRVASDCDILLNDFPPYLIKGDAKTTTTKHPDGTLEKGITKLIAKCGQKCKNTKWIPNKTLMNNPDQVMKRLRENKAMFVLPIPVEVGANFSQYNDTTLKVIPTVEKSNWILIVDIGRCREELSSEIFQIIWKQSPILPIMLLVAAIAGVILWVLEARHNDKEFSSSFFRGTFDGFWWAFISMTTVGYGDKTPRTILGKVFGMIWITMGIVIISFFTATIASTITIATVEKSCHMMKNRNVAIISNDKEVKDYVTERSAKKIIEFDSFSAMFEALRNNERGGINSLFVEEHIALMYFYGHKDKAVIKNVRVTKSTKDVNPTKRTTLFYSVMKNSSSPCGLNEMDFKDLLSESGLPKPAEMYKTGFEEEVDQPFSINSPETIPILKILSICFGSLAVSGYIGITIINCVKGKKKKPEFDRVGASSHEMESNASTKRRIVQLQQSLNLIAQEVKEMRDVLDSTDA